MKRRLPILLALSLAAAPPLFGRVFWGIGGAPESGLIDAGDPAFRQAYETELIINGGRARARVWGTPRTPDEVLTALQAKARQAGARAAFASGGSLAWGIIVQPDQRVERVLVSAAEGRYAHVFHLLQTGDDFLRSLRPPDRLPFDAPAPGGGRILSAFANEGTGGGVATIDCNVPETALRPAYAQQLQAAGWQRAPAGGGDAAMFLRDGYLLLVSAKRAGADDRSLVTLVRKRLRPGERL